MIGRLRGTPAAGRDAPIDLICAPLLMAAKRPMAAHSGSGAAVLLSAGAEPPAYAFPAYCGDVVEVAAHDQAAPRPGQADIEVLAAAALVAYAVHGKDHDRPLEAFEAKDVAVEHVVTGEERIPVTEYSSATSAGSWSRRTSQAFRSAVRPEPNPGTSG